MAKNRVKVEDKDVKVRKMSSSDGDIICPWCGLPSKIPIEEAKKGIVTCYQCSSPFKAEYSMKLEIKKFEPPEIPEEQYEREADAIARMFCPPIKKCKYCGHPHIDGYVCESCGDRRR